MKPSNALVPFSLAIMAAEPASANVGQGFKVFTDLLAGIGDIIVNSNNRKRSDMDPMAAIRHLGRRQSGSIPGVPQFEFDRCYADLGPVTITVNSPDPPSLSISGVPPTCMNLANVIVGEVEGPFAVPCGSDCLSYSGLTEQERNEFLDIFK